MNFIPLSNFLKRDHKDRVKQYMANIDNQEMGLGGEKAFGATMKESAGRSLLSGEQH